VFALLLVSALLVGLLAGYVGIGVFYYRPPSCTSVVSTFTWPLQRACGHSCSPGWGAPLPT
jgi:hypothetical protein